MLVTASQASVFTSRSSHAAAVADMLEADDASGQAAAPVSIDIQPRDGFTGVLPVGQVKVEASSGTLADVRMHNEQGRAVAGRMAADRSSWEPAEPLGYGRTYALTATAAGTDGGMVTRNSQFSTVSPQGQVGVTLGMTSGAPLSDGGVYGVGTVIVATFDSGIVDRAAAEKRLRVTTSPDVQGAWSWINDRKAHWRPREYFPSGTEVKVKADLYGTDLGGGLFGDRDREVSFRIGPSRIAIADDKTKQVEVFENGKLIRTMPTSMGRGGTETVGGRTIAFWTQPGVYTVMEKQNPVLMDSSTYGLPVDSASGYKISVPHAVRISPNGIYLHEREATVWAQGNTNVSAGCLNLSAENAQWYYEFANPGDVVEVRNTGGAPLPQWNNGDWSVPWEQWVAGSALNS
ncbi:L,D-transpeptidase [Mycobacterium sp. smrl_JER01]